MPFSKSSKTHTEDYWKKHFEDFLKLEIEKTQNVEAYRSKPLRGDLIKEIIKELCTADIVISDLTDLNSNVLYELGIRQSLSYRTITIAEAGTKLPFDISTKGTLFYYPKDHIKNARFCTNLKEAILDCINNPNQPDSIVLDIISSIDSFNKVLTPTNKDIKSILEKCYEGLVKICDFFFQKLEKSRNPDTLISLTDDEVFLCVKKIEKNKEICYQYLDIYYEARDGVVKKFGTSTIIINFENLSIKIWLEDGRFPLNMYFLLINGDRRGEKEKIITILDRIKNKISKL